MRFLFTMLVAAVPTTVSSFALAPLSSPKHPLVMDKAAESAATVVAARCSSQGKYGTSSSRPRHRPLWTELCATEGAGSEGAGGAEMELLVEVKGGIRVRMIRDRDVVVDTVPSSRVAKLEALASIVSSFVPRALVCCCCVSRRSARLFHCYHIRTATCCIIVCTRSMFHELLQSYHTTIEPIGSIARSVISVGFYTLLI